MKKTNFSAMMQRRLFIFFLGQGCLRKNDLRSVVLFSRLKCSELRKFRLYLFTPSCVQFRFNVINDMPLFWACI